MPNDKVGNAFYKLGTKIKFDVTLVNIPAHCFSNRAVARLKADFLQEIIDRDPHFLTHAFIERIFGSAKCLNIRLEAGIGQWIKAGGLTSASRNEFSLCNMSVFQFFTSYCIPNGLLFLFAYNFDSFRCKCS